MHEDRGSRVDAKGRRNPVGTHRLSAADSALDLGSPSFDTCSPAPAHDS
jgi:hypothetical protein